MSHGFREFVGRDVWPLLQLTGRPSTLQRRKQTSAQIAHALISTGLVGAVVADPRNNAEPAARGRLEVWEAFIKAGLCRKCTGSEESRRVTRYRTTGQLLDLYELLGNQLIAPISGDECPRWAAAPS